MAAPNKKNIQGDIWYARLVLDPKSLTDQHS